MLIWQKRRTSKSHISSFMFKEIINVAKAFGSPERKANTVHIPFPPEGNQESCTVKSKMCRVSVANRKRLNKYETRASLIN